MDYEYDAEAHRERIMGQHVKEYMDDLAEEDPERYKVQFAKYIDNDIEADGLEDMYTECLQKIKENPKFEKDVRTVKVTHKRHGNTVIPSDDSAKYVRAVKRSNAQRKDRVHQKMAAARQKLMAAMGDE